MPKIRFQGKIFPEGYIFTLGYQIHAQWRAPNDHVVVTYTLTIENSAITVDCDVNDYDERRDFTRILMRAHDTAKTAVDLASFRTGSVLQMSLDQFTDPDGKTTKIAAGTPDFGVFSTSLFTDTDFQIVLQIALEDPRISFAIRDMIEAVGGFHTAPLKCALVVDSLREYFLPPGKSKEAGWPVLRETLNVSARYLRGITNVSRGPRHGNRDPIPSAVSNEIAARAWKILNRFLEYKKRGNQPLSLVDFPLLD